MANPAPVTAENFDEWWQLTCIHVQRHNREARRRAVLARLDSKLASIRDADTEH